MEDGSNPFEQGTVGIAMEHVTFGYRPESPVLEDVSLTIEPNHRIAIVGASGSGKTTLAQILVGFYQPGSGTLLYGGTPAEAIGYETIRENVGLVLQSPSMLNDTVHANLTLGREIEETAIWEALDIAQMKTVVEEMPDGLQTRVGKNGIRLSGGQRQRLAIARMILQQPKIAIFDESTSALDVHTESRLFEALEPFMRERTTLFIAHRLSTVQNADYIYVLERGKIVQQGTHDALLEEEGHYRHFVHQQMHKGHLS